MTGQTAMDPAIRLPMLAHVLIQLQRVVAHLLRWAWEEVALLEQLLAAEDRWERAQWLSRWDLRIAAAAH